MMRAARILETVLYARDIAAARAFYEGVLGLTVYDEVKDRFVFFKFEGQMLLIFNPDLTARQQAAKAPPPHGASGAGHLCFRGTYTELESWERHLTSHGVAIERTIDWPDGGRSVYFRDPAGNSLEFADGAIWEFPEIRTLANQKIVIATHNAGKLEEFAQLLKPHGVSTVSAGELGLAEPAETGTTFVENARIKAEFAVKATGLVTIADDSGLCVEALDGAPGVYTADWAGPQRDWMLAMTRVNDELSAHGAVTPEQRRAEFACTLLVKWPDGHERMFEGRAPGHLTWPPRGTLGHGYDPIFVPRGLSQTFAELDPAAKNLISHRALALEKLVRDLF